MHVKITTSGPRRYVQLVESFRDEQGRIRKRTVATLGRLDQVGSSLDAVINGLLKATGRAPVLGAEAQPEVEFEPARALGAVWALQELWKTLGFGELRRVFRGTRHQIDVEALVRVMVFNRLCDPESKLGVLRWLKTVRNVSTFFQQIGGFFYVTTSGWASGPTAGPRPVAFNSPLITGSSDPQT